MLSSPERYPFEHRIASDKNYMRNLHTIDIEGAASNTRVNQSIKYKHRAQEEIARRRNQSVKLETTAEDRRRALAHDTLDAYQTRMGKKSNPEQSQPQNNQKQKTEQHLPLPPHSNSITA